KIMPQLLTQQREAMSKGWDLLLAQDPTNSAAKVKERLNTFLEKQSISSALEVCPDEDWANLLPIPRIAMENGKKDDAVAMYNVLQVLRPDEPQPYVGNFTIVWERAGVQVAADCYRLMMPFVLSPTYFYYAADCFQHAGEIEEAKETLQAAIDLLENEELGFSIDPELKADIYAFRDELKAPATGQDLA
ncbi:MAG: hypothetical protein AAGC93_32015, partial [Cyanobacteria bacterium P01_F01_bin.53]